VADLSVGDFLVSARRNWLRDSPLRARWEAPRRDRGSIGNVRGDEGGLRVILTIGWLLGLEETGHRFGVHPMGEALPQHHVIGTDKAEMCGCLQFR
jgi:hypothetical protein